MKKIAMIAMLFGFVGAVHAGTNPEPFKAQDVVDAMDAIEESMSARVCHPIFGCTGLKPESEYDIKLDTDPLCNTDSYSCFHLADHDATVVQEDMQLAIPILIWIYNQL